MTQSIKNVIYFAVALFFGVLRMIPNVTLELVTECVTAFKQGLDDALAAWAANPTESVQYKIEDLIHDGLQMIKNALDAAGHTTMDSWLTFADNVDLAIKGGASPFLAELKAGWHKVFGKKE